MKKQFTHIKHGYVKSVVHSEIKSREKRKQFRLVSASLAYFEHENEYANEA